VEENNLTGGSNTQNLQLYMQSAIITVVSLSALLSHANAHILRSYSCKWWNETTWNDAI